MPNKRKYKTAKQLRLAVERYITKNSRILPRTEETWTGELDDKGHRVMTLNAIKAEDGSTIEYRAWAVPPNIGGLCRELGISRRTWSEYANPEKHPEFVEVVQDVQDLMQTWLEEELLTRPDKELKGIIFNLERLSDLTDAAATLVDGTDTLSDNMELFEGKMGTLDKKIKTYRKDGVKKLTKGISTLAANGPALVKGVKEYADGVTEMADGVSAYVKGAGQIADGNSDLYEAVKGLPAQINTFDKGLKTYTDGVDKLGQKENVTALKGGAKAVSDGVASLNTNLTQLKATFAQNEKIIAGLKAAGADATLIASLEQVTAGQKAAIEQMETATSDSGDLKKGAVTLAGGVNTVMDGLSTLAGSSASLTGGSKTLKTQMPNLVASIKTLKEGGDKLVKNNKTLTDGAKKLKKASKTMKKQTKKLNTGMKTLKKGGKDLNKATDTLVSGVSKLSEASGKLDKGAGKLASGMSKFRNEGVSKLESVYEEDIKSLLDRLDAVIEAGKKYDSFSGIGSGMKGDVKFIIETEALEKED